jgi:hypothetical protein
VAKSFRDILALSGYSTRRADNPLVVRDYDSNARRISSGSCGADRSQGPTGLLQDERGPVVQKLTPPINDNISTTGVMPVLRSSPIQFPKK